MSSTFKRVLVGVFVVALALRLVHNQALLADPLYSNPLGGNLPLLLMAEEIAQGDLVPMDGPFQVNSPLYPYLLAGIYAFTSANDFHAVRVLGAVADAATCALVALLALRHLGLLAGALAGFGLALYAPMIFFSTDLVPVPFTLVLVAGALVLLDGARPGGAPEPDGAAGDGPEPTWRRWALAGLLLGLATTMRPDLLLAGALALGLPFLWRVTGPWRAAAALAGGLAVGIAPVTTLNAVASGGEFVLLTTSGGHNLYIGHNPEAEPQYALPAGLDERDIFTSMRALAEEVEGRPMDGQEVSDYYTAKALAWVRANPARELSLLGQRALAVVNDFEPTTYANFYYQRELSPVLRWTLTFGAIFPFALVGMAVSLDRRRAHLWIPFLAAAATVLLFFFIDRLRIGVMPSVGFFLGAGAWAIRRELEAPRASRIALVAVAIVAGALVANRPILRVDTSNEWNKAGGVLRLHGLHREAEAAFQRALEVNPSSADAYRNLVVLYRETGRPAEAARAEAAARQLLDRQQADVATYRRALEGVGRE